MDIYAIAIIVVFILGYFAIVLEEFLGVNKATSALLMGVFTWILEFASDTMTIKSHLSLFGHQISDIAQIVIFLVGVLAIVEIMNTHDAFRIVAKFLRFKEKRKMLWMLGIITFFLSAILGSITTTIVMLALLDKVTHVRANRLLLGASIVLSANAGGAFSPIGDITTTMLWIGGQISTLGIVGKVFLPSLCCLLISLFVLQFSVSGEFEDHSEIKKYPPKFMHNLIFFLGFFFLLMVPVFKMVTGLPPFMGVLLGLGLLWLITDLLHGEDEDRAHLLVPKVISRLDFTGAFFFLGILLSIGAMETIGILGQLAHYLDEIVGNYVLIATGMGLLSAIVDSVPLVAAAMGMYSLEQFPQNHLFWELIAYCAGVGGSILIFGSAPGVAYMGLEKVGFFWYARNISVPALLSYVGGLAVYWFI